jgi:hypothetical protein
MRVLVMSRGPTRRVRRLQESGAVTIDVLRAADHEPNLLGHPYVGLEHLELARLRLAGLDHERQDMLQHIRAATTGSRWWRPARARTDCPRAA